MDGYGLKCKDEDTEYRGHAHVIRDQIGYQDGLERQHPQGVHEYEANFDLGQVV